MDVSRSYSISWRSCALWASISLRPSASHPSSRRSQICWKLCHRWRTFQNQGLSAVGTAMSLRMFLSCHLLCGLSCGPLCRSWLPRCRARFAAFLGLCSPSCIWPGIGLWLCLGRLAGFDWWCWSSICSWNRLIMALLPWPIFAWIGTKSLIYLGRPRPLYSRPTPRYYRCTAPRRNSFASSWTCRCRIPLIIDCLKNPSSPSQILGQTAISQTDYHHKHSEQSTMASSHSQSWSHIRRPAQP